MSQHVRVNLEAEPGFDTGALDHLGKARLRKRCAALGEEHEIAVRRFPPELAKRPHLVALQQMRGRIALLGPAHMKPMAIEINLIPPQIHKLDRSESVPIGDEDHRRIPMTAAVFLGRFDEAIDLGRRQMLAAAQFTIRSILRTVFKDRNAGKSALFVALDRVVGLFAESLQELNHLPGLPRSKPLGQALDEMLAHFVDIALQAEV
jgi:hypothetical protein